MDFIDYPEIKKLLASRLKNQCGDLILCRCCNNPITSHHDQAIIGNNSQHSFTNPSHVTYHLRCFNNAHGCAIVGTPTQQHSWFAGYRWQLSYCMECSEQLGWYYQYYRYQHSQRCFFGLIAGRLINAIGKTR